MRQETAEQRRQTSNFIRLGTVAEVDVAQACIRVKTGELLSDWIPWLVPRTGATIEWSAPSVGEQGIVLCPEGDTTGAVFLRGLYSDAVPAPSQSASEHLVRYADGTSVQYNTTSHALNINMASGGNVTLTADAGVTINGDVQVNGSVTASIEVEANGIKLTQHTHSDVEAGTSSTGKPQ